jgi:hypothetical protein
MGFNLKTFFDDLEFMLNNADMKDIKRFVDEEKQYAKECGQLDD